MSKHDDLLVSIVIGTKNEEENIEPLLISIKNQTYPNIQTIIVDHINTKDRTSDIAKRYTSDVYTFGDERSLQRNYGIEKSNGEFILILDADMVLSPKVVESCVKIVQDKQDAAGIIIQEISLGEGFWAECKKLEKELISGVEWIEAARFFRRRVLNNIGGYDIGLISGEDWDLSQRASKFGKIYRTSEPIYHKDIEPSFIKNIKKKFFYGQHIGRYYSKEVNSSNSKRQMSLINRYTIYLRNPRKTFKNPLVGLGMLFIKTSEFIAIATGLFVSKLHKYK